MFGFPGPTKLLVLVAIISAIWFGFRLLGRDDAHVWVKETLFATGAEPALERDVIEPLADAVAKAKVL